MSDCRKCGGWGIGDSLHTHERFPCPECGAGAVRPFAIEKDGARLLLHNPKWGFALTVGKGSGDFTIRLSAGEMLGLATALTAAARKAK